MRLGIFRAPNLAAANLAQLLLGAAWIPMWFFLNLYLQQVLGYGAFAGGAALLPMTVADHGRHGRRRPAGHGALRRQAADRRRPARCSPPGWLAVARAPRRHLRRRRAARLAGRGAGHGAGVHPVARHGDLRAPARGGRPGLRHRQHQLPGRLRARPGRDDRRRRRPTAPTGSATSPRSPTATPPRSSAPAGIAVAGAVLAAALLRAPKPAAAVVESEAGDELPIAA